MHQPVVTNVATLRGYRQDLAMLESLSGLSPAFRSQVCGQILGGDSIPMLTATFSRIIRVSTRTDVPLHHLLISLSCTLDVVEVVVVIADAILEEVAANLVRDAIFLVDD